MSEIDTLSVGELVDELATLAAHISAGMCRWLELVGEFDRRGRWAAWGYGSCAEWLAWRCALTPRSAREHVRVARALSGLPLVWSAFSGGQLSYAEVRALTRVAAPRKEAELLQLAAVMTASQLERALRSYRRVTSEEARGLQEEERLEWYWDEDGSLVVHGRLAPEDGALFLQALAVSRERLWQVGQEEGRGSAEPPPVSRRPSRVDALVALAEQAGTPLNLGRKTRTIPPSLRRALTVRDRGCRFPGCDRCRFLDAHHIHYWGTGGETALGNLLLLCRRHHRLVHEGGYTVDHQGRFYDPHGHAIPPVPSQQPGTLTALRDSNRDLEITPKTCAPRNHRPREATSSCVERELQIGRQGLVAFRPCRTARSAV
jgi:hypothetical protein